MASMLDRFVPGQLYTLRAQIDEAMVRRFADFSGDANPIHLEAAEAKAYGYSRQVAHGAILVAFISRAIGMEIPGPGAVWMRQSIEWLQPVYVGDEVAVTVRIRSVSAAASILTLETTATNQKGVLVMKGEATVKISKKMDSQNAPRPDSPVALVTGGSRGIGAAIARELAAQGHRVAVCYHAAKTDAQALVQEIIGRGGQADAFAADVGIPKDVARLIEQVQAKWKRIDVVVHGASPTPPRGGKVQELSYSDIEPFLKTYIGGGVALAQGAVPEMTKNKFGRFIFLGTSALFGTPPAGMAAYLIAKEALWGLVKSMAVELGPAGITTNLISPGLTITDMTAEVPARVKEIEAGRSPMRRLASAEDTAALAAFLASPAAGYLNGAHLPLTGGPV
jgi:3-oxoacyl-[acyl-carrier protein] reductase